MRLTLRTLLAYMDEILEPADREELTKKIESSDFANDLIHRTKDTTRRLRLSAPQVLGTGMGLDPNTVAEYLDNMLPPDSVADFERICLESDVHLAEVASCHHVLTMVLGEPAEVDAAARQRMYSMPAEIEQRKQLRVESAHVPAGAASAAAVSSLASDQAASRQPVRQVHDVEVPDYLRASASSTIRWALAGLAAVLLISITAVLFSGASGWFGGEDELADNSAATAALGPSEPDTNETQEDVATSIAANEPSPGVEPSEIDSASGSSVADAPPPFLIPGMGGTSLSDSATVAGSPPQTNSSPVGFTDSSDYQVTASDAANRYGYDSVDTAPAAPTDDTGTMDESHAPLASDESGAAGSAIDENSGESMRIASNATVSAMDGSASLPGDSEGAIVAEETVESIDVVPELGTYLDAKNILLRYDAEEGAWFRMTPRSAILAGDRMLAMPAFYPRITLSSGLHLKLAGGTQVSLEAAPMTASGDASDTSVGVPDLKVAYGRVVLVNTANEENQVTLSIGETKANVRLVPNATLAVEVEPRYVPGRDPRSDSSSMAVRLYVREGSVDWTVAEESQTITSPSRWSVVDGHLAALNTDAAFPDWIDHEPVQQRSEQLYGVPTVEQSLDELRPVENQLLELYQASRRREVKSLVAKSSVYVGQFVPFVEALRDSEQKATWKTQIDTLRSAMALGPDSADRVRQTLVDQRGDAAARDLYEMLCGYSADQVGQSPEEVAAGPIVRLIDWVEDDSLDYRVLAVQNLAEITGKRLLSNPAASPSERAQGARRWRDRLKSGELTPVTD